MILIIFILLGFVANFVFLDQAKDEIHKVKNKLLKVIFYTSCLVPYMFFTFCSILTIFYLTFDFINGFINIFKKENRE